MTRDLKCRKRRGTACSRIHWAAQMRAGNTYFSEFPHGAGIDLADLCRERDGGEEHAVVAVGDEVLGAGDEMVDVIWHALDDPQRTEGGLVEDEHCARRKDGGQTFFRM